jgi:hypothetical protein
VPPAIILSDLAQGGDHADGEQKRVPMRLDTTGACLLLVSTFIVTGWNALVILVIIPFRLVRWLIRFGESK